MSEPEVLTVKRGDTWAWTLDVFGTDGLPMSLAGVTARMQVRTPSDALLADYSEYLTVGASSVSLLVLKNQLLVGIQYFDVELTFPDGTVISTETLPIVVVKDITLEAAP